MSKSKHGMTTTDERGFRIYATLRDSNRGQVQVKESSAATEPKVWIFCGWAGIDRPPHLTVEQARIVRDGLSQFIADASEDEPAVVVPRRHLAALMCAAGAGDDMSSWDVAEWAEKAYPYITKRESEAAYDAILERLRGGTEDDDGD